MKKILFALTIALLLPLTQRAQAATAVSLNFFYDNLSADGSWIEVADYGYCFQPNVAVNNPNWRPYADGYWAYTEDGWTWVSYEDFGWATYHYGRWARLADYGWVWVPGYEWAPAWVSWRTGGDYVGWAPLPPAADHVYEGRAITGHVDVEFDIGPQYYNFVDVRYIGEPVLRDRILEPQRNITIINNTVNVTNITYRNSTVYNHGPDYDRLSEYSTRPIQRLSIQRETSVGANFGGQGGGHRNFNRVNGNQLMVVAPQIQKSQQAIAPKRVKAKVQQPKVEHGWQGIANREQLQAQMKKENPKSVPPPSFQPQKGRQGKGAATAAGQNAGAQPNEKPEKNQQPAQEAQQKQKNAEQTPGENVNTRNARNGKRQPKNAERRESSEPNASEAQPQTRQPRGRAQKQEQQTDRSGEARENNGPRRTENAHKKQEQKAERPEPAQAQQPKQAKSQRRERAENPGAEDARNTVRARESNPAEKAKHAEKARNAEEPQRVEKGHNAEKPERVEKAHGTEKPQPAKRGSQAQERAKPSRNVQRAEKANPGEQGQDKQQPNDQKKRKKKEEKKPDQP